MKDVAHVPAAAADSVMRVLRTAWTAVALAAGIAAVTAPAATAAVATTSGFQPGAPPELCESEYFADQIGTNRSDALEAGEAPQRLWGRAGADYLYGSDSRASCLLGGRDPDVLVLWYGGGGAWGEHGSDEILGSSLDDLLDGGEGHDTLNAGAGSDTIHPGEGADGVDAGEGDDRIRARDGRGEVIDCGPGSDVAVADRLDVLFNCESSSLAGRQPLRLVPSPRAAQRSSVVRFRLRVPEAAGGEAYRVVLVNGCDGARPTVLQRFPRAGSRVRRGQSVRVGLRPPTGSWCPGTVEAAVLLYRPCASSRGCAVPPPPESVARLEFQAG